MRMPAHGGAGLRDAAGAGRSGRAGKAGKAARLGWIALSGICGAIAVAAPCWLHGVPAGAGWSGLGLLAGALHGACGHRRLHALACMMALAAGMSIDFARVPPFALLAWCGGGGLADTLFLAHLRWFPATSLAMLALAWPAPPRTWPHAWPRIWLHTWLDAWLRACLGALPRFAGMLAAMSLAAQGARTLAPLARVDWSAGAMTGAMLAGMLLFLHARPAARAAGTGAQNVARSVSRRVRGSTGW